MSCGGTRQGRAVLIATESIDRNKFDQDGADEPANYAYLNNLIHFSLPAMWSMLHTPSFVWVSAPQAPFPTIDNRHRLSLLSIDNIDVRPPQVALNHTGRAAT